MITEFMQSVTTQHIQAMEWLDKAFVARTHGDKEAAFQHFAEAFRLEKQAAEALLPHLDLEPTRSILLRSAASLALECGREEEAERLACIGLSGTPPREIRAELREVLMRLWHTP